MLSVEFGWNWPRGSGGDEIGKVCNRTGRQNKMRVEDFSSDELKTKQKVTLYKQNKQQLNQT